MTTETTTVTTVEAVKLTGNAALAELKKYPSVCFVESIIGDFFKMSINTECWYLVEELADGTREVVVSRKTGEANAQFVAASLPKMPEALPYSYRFDSKLTALVGAHLSGELDRENWIIARAFEIEFSERLNHMIGNYMTDAKKYVKSTKLDTSRFAAEFDLKASESVTRKLSHKSERKTNPAGTPGAQRGTVKADEKLKADGTPSLQGRIKADNAAKLALWREHAAKEGDKWFVENFEKNMKVRVFDNYETRQKREPEWVPTEAQNAKYATHKAERERVQPIIEEMKSGKRPWSVAEIKALANDWIISLDDAELAWGENA